MKILPSHDVNQQYCREDNGDEAICNQSDNRTFAAILATRMERRTVLKGSMNLAMSSMFGVLLPACATTKTKKDPNTASLANHQGPSLLGFRAVPVSAKDTLVVPEGYRTQVLLPWGEPITGDYPPYAVDNTGSQQAEQMGMHHDGMHFFPIEGQNPYQGSSVDGFLVMNHEYIEPRYLHQSARGRNLGTSGAPIKKDGTRVADEVLKELNAHGVSVTRITKGPDGQWQKKADARNRRITGLTPMKIAGPVKGSNFVKTVYSPEATMTRGTLSNCSHGVTPWNTYLAAEENWAGYFVNHDTTLPREHRRYGIRDTEKGSRYAWERAEGSADEYIRFDASTRKDSAERDYRNEPNCFGWMVEINPFQPQSIPVKHTALGRFAHEGVVFAKTTEGQPIVCYSGDDAAQEYIYKFVSAKPYHQSTAGGHLLESGTLYVAKFDDDGRGTWLPLVFGQGVLLPKHGFTSQADVLVNTRLAADTLGATPMDRPEWGAVDPKTAHVYFTLTNNTARSASQVTAANPRANNQWGHIIRWQESGDNPAATTFEWDIFILAGPSDKSLFAGDTLTEEQMFSSPDGLWFDQDARLWIQTDVSDSVLNQGLTAQFGNNQMLACDPVHKQLRRFLTGPIGQEITGVVTTPDQKTMFVNVQHPGGNTSPEDFAKGQTSSRWPDFDRGIYPRSATVVISKNDGGKIGS